jgi:uncharacterized repeat protein (TIGR01451 family)
MRLALLAILLLCACPATTSAVPVAAGHADLGVSLTDTTDPVSGGTDLTYLITVSNGGPDAAGATLADSVPSGTTFKSLDVPTGWSCTTPTPGNTGSVSCSTASIAANGSATFALTVHVDPSIADATVLSNTATVGTTASDSNPQNDSATETTTIENNADLAITKSASADTVLPGGQLTYTIDVTNNGPADAANAEWSDTLPPETTFVSEQQGSGPTFTCSTPSVGAGGAVDCAILSLPAGSTASFTVTVLVNPELSSAAITNTATVSSDTEDVSEDPNNSSSATTYVQTAGDLSITKTGPATATAGNIATYTIVVSNNGAVPVGNVVMTDNIPPGTTFSDLSGGPEDCSTPDPGEGGTVECTIPSLDPGSPVTYKLKLAVLPDTPHGSTITNTASVSSSTNTDPQPNNDSSSSTANVQSSADLAVSNSDSPDPVLAGNQITYTIDVANAGPASATSVTLADALPAGTTFVSVSAPSGFSCTTPAVGANGSVTCSGGTVDLGGASFQLVVKVDSSVAAGTMLSDTATVSTPTPDPNPGNESANATTTVNTQADVAISKSGSPDTVAPTQDITYTIDVQNNGPSDAANVSMTDTLPSGTSFKSLTQDSGPTFSCTTGGVVTCSVATLADGAKAEFTLVVTVDANADGAISNTASISTTTPESSSQNDSATASTSVQPQADLAVTKSDSPDPVTAGSDLTYTLGVKNNGPNGASNVALSDDLPAGTSFKSISAPAGFSCTTPSVGSGGKVSCTGSSLAGGASASFTLVVHVAADRANGSTLSNTASASNDVTDPNSANDSATSTTSVTTSADLSTSVSDSPDPVTAGNVVTYHMHIQDAGPSDASQPRLTVPIPSGTTLIGAAQTDGSAFNCTSDGTTVTCAAGSLASGGSAAIDMAVRTAHSQSGTISAKPEASSSTTDPDSSNDASSETTTITTAPPSVPPTSVTIGAVRKLRASGAIVVTVRCIGRSRQFCPVGVTMTFKPPNADLAPIHGGQPIRAGRHSLVYLIGSVDERRAIKRIRALPAHISVTNSNGTGAERDVTVR